MSEQSEDDITIGLYSIAQELQAVAVEGLKHYSNDYNERRYRKALELSARLLGIIDNNSQIAINGDFTDNTGIKTPFIGTEAAVFRDHKLLLIKRHDDKLWAVPGGGVDIGETLAESVLRELKEETTLTGSIKRLLGIFDSRIWRSRLKFHGFHIIYEVDAGNAMPEKTVEAIDCGFFAEDNLPDLSPGHDKRVPFLFKLQSGEEPVPYFD